MAFWRTERCQFLSEGDVLLIRFPLLQACADHLGYPNIRESVAMVEGALEILARQGDNSAPTIRQATPCYKSHAALHIIDDTCRLGSSCQDKTLSGGSG